MYIRKVTKSNPGLTKRYTYYRLAETYRGVDGKVRQRSLLPLGKLEGVPPHKHKLLADKIEQLYRGDLSLFNEVIDPQLDKLAETFCAELLKKQEAPAKAAPVLPAPAAAPPRPARKPDWVTVDLNSLEAEDARELGAAWLSLQVMRAAGVVPLLEAVGLKGQSLTFCLLAWLSRMVHPASERATASWLAGRSALPELLGIRPSQVNRFKLYHSARQLYACKQEIEQHLSAYTRQLFSLNQTIWLYDLTNTYFEGRMEGAEKAVQGHSKEKRSDAPLVSLALVTDQQGFPQYTHFYEGNVREPATVADLLDTLVAQSPAPDQEPPLVVIDAGIATEETLQLIRQKGCDYLCVSRRSLRHFEPDPDQFLTLQTQAGEEVTLQAFSDPAFPNERLLYIKSPGRTRKEQAISDKLTPRFLAELETAKAALSKRGGIKATDKVHQRIGRIRNRYPRVAPHYEITLTEDPVKGRATDLSWTAKPSASTEPQGQHQLGAYFLRSSRTELTEADMWQLYHSLTETEDAFRTLKTDLSIRPVYHQKDYNIFAHLFLGVLAYYFVAIIRHQLKAQGIQHRWKTLLEIMDSQKILTISCRDRDQNQHFVRKSTRPRAEVKAIYQALGLQPVPFYQKKYVVPQ